MTLDSFPFPIACEAEEEAKREKLRQKKEMESVNFALETSQARKLCSYDPPTP